MINQSMLISFCRLISKITIVASFFLALLGAQASEAQNPFPIASVKVNGLSQFQGSYLSAFYAVGDVSGISMSVNDLYLSQVYEKVADLKITSDSVTLPAQNITWEGWAKPNVLVLVVHAQPGYTWKNGDPDASQPILPEGMTITENTKYLSISTVSIRLLNRAGPTQATNYTFNVLQPLADFIKTLPHQ